MKYTIDYRNKLIKNFNWINITAKSHNKDYINYTKIFLNCSLRLYLICAKLYIVFCILQMLITVAKERRRSDCGYEDRI